MQTEVRFGPSYTPKIILQLIITILAVSLTSALWDSLVSNIFGWTYLQSYIALSKWGISHYLIWQFVSYFFVVDSYGSGITFPYLINTFFFIYLLWVMGSAVCTYSGPRQFLKLYFTSGILCGVVAFLLLWLFRTDMTFAGPSAPLLALFTVWCFLNPETEILLFLLFPVRIKWLFAGVVGGLTLVCLSQRDFISFIFYFTAIAIGYLFSTVSLETGSPFQWTRSLDDKLIRFGKRRRNKKSKEPSESKIVQLFSGKPEVDDETFLDEMLNQISEKGPDSLTWQQRKRMDAIAKKRQH